VLHGAPITQAAHGNATFFAGLNMQFKVGRKKDQAAHLVNQLRAEQSLRSQMQ